MAITSERNGRLLGEHPDDLRFGPVTPRFHNLAVHHTEVLKRIEREPTSCRGNAAALTGFISRVLDARSDQLPC